MPNVGDIQRWITENEALLSGVVALFVLMGDDLVVGSLRPGARTPTRASSRAR